MSLMYAEKLDDMLTHMEGRVFGAWFRFTVIGYCNQLHASLPNGGWNEIEGFRDWPKMRDFAEELNIVIQPVIDKYALLMRQDLANELVGVAAEELKSTKSNVEESK